MTTALLALGHDPQTAGLMRGMVLAMVVLLLTPALLVGAAAWWLARSRRPVREKAPGPNHRGR